MDNNNKEKFHENYIEGRNACWRLSVQERQ